MSWDKNKHADKRRHRGRDLQRERARLFREQPLCVECEKKGRVTVATIRDHIIPLAEGGQDTPENTQALCEDCHNIKKSTESAKGRGAALFFIYSQNYINKKIEPESKCDCGSCREIITKRFKHIINGKGFIIPRIAIRIAVEDILKELPKPPKGE